ALLTHGTGTADKALFPFKPQWIAENELLYTADGHIRVRTIPGYPRTIPFSARISLQRATYEIAHRSLEPTGPQNVRGIVTPVVAPNGRAVAFAALGDLWIMPKDGAPIRITDDGAMELDPAWSPDRTRLAFASDRTGRMQTWIHALRSEAQPPRTERR